MKKRLLFFIALLSNIFLVFTQIQKKAAPSWIEKIDYSINPDINLDDVIQGNLILLYDEQIHIDKKENYFHFATKITENVGIQPASSINITFDPTYQSLVIHSLNIIRDGEVINKLHSSDFQTIRRELNAESYIYDGSISAITNISDVRTGDIIDYSYTIKGFNPIHQNLYSAIFNLSSSIPYGKFFIKIITQKPIEYRLLKTDFKLNQTKKGNSYIYTLNEKNINPFKYEANTPSWYIDSGILNISNYKSWENVINWGINVFKVNKSLSKNLKEKILLINNENKSQGEKISAVLNFIQNDIRYLGLESGIGAYKPFTPNKVFEQRYGDCKDKSLLMVTMLNSMGIEAYPVLVNTYLKGTIKKLLPATENFNHCVVKVIDENKNELWFDPTISNQGGDYKNIVFPDYRYGLVLKKGNKGFDKTPSPSPHAMDVTDTFILDKEGKGATLNISTIYYQSGADYMREYYKNNSINSIKKEYENYYSKYFNNIKSIKNLEYNDDLANNTFTIYENYRIDSLWTPSINKGQIAVNFYPYTISEVISLPTKLDRKTPFALSFPIERNHTIKVYLPEDWKMNQDSYGINSLNISYDLDIYYNKFKNLLTINHSFKTLKDHVTTEEFPEFFSDLQTLDKQMVYNITTTNEGLSNNDKTSLFWLKTFGSLLFFLSVGFSIWLALKIYNYNPVPVIESHFESEKQIGGWLVLIGLGLCLSPFRVLFDLFTNTIYINGDWLTYISSNNLGFNPAIGFLLFLETIINAFLIIYYPLAIILFFKKRSSFPKVHALFLIGFFLFNLIDQLIASYYLNDDVSNSISNDLLRMFISCSLIVPYLLFSDRAKETFVKLKKRE
ncbi:DUF2569 family protein [Tenacibaculum aiptasiae]|uniref:DUF2569 family protein n=1 Tax=Tenacibaculum aiptasiae TaxID=426481 RepID=A0A7J5ASC3_9FLAO|nr:DUF3857 domain-containing protein [Tenacibaculum aiptasiae]KAB1160311.1 DUF2569 family protein [Tenacibaculum aiptasiae]